MDTPTDRKVQLLKILKLQGLLKLAEPVTLASGAKSRFFLDGKASLAHGENLKLACECFLDLAKSAEVDFDAVGGLTLGADQFSHGVAIVGNKEWFVVRKQPKGRGTDRYVEGSQLQGKKVLLVDDVITTGGSSITALERVEAEGGKVVFATALAIRSDEPLRRFAAINVDFKPLFTYDDLGIPEVGTETAA